MDILKPEFIYIEDLCFRRNYPAEFEKFTSYQDLEQNEDYMEDDNCHDSTDADVVINFVNDEYVHSVSVPTACLSFIIGSRGLMKKKIEDETKTSVVIPKKNCGNLIKIYGKTKSSILSARTRIKLIVSSSRFKLDVTHFLSVPLVDEKLIGNFNIFKEDLIHNFKMDKSLFQVPEKLHLTIGMLHLLDEEDILSAENLIHQAWSQIKDSCSLDGDLRVRLKGLEYMNDDPKMVNILYAKISLQDENDERLQKMCDCLEDLFVDAGYMRRERDNLKLHATVINTKYSKLVKSFDISDIMKKYGDYEFGHVTLKRLCISERYSTDSEDKYFKSTSRFNF